MQEQPRLSQLNSHSSLILSSLSMPRVLFDQVCSVLKSVIPDIENDRQAVERYNEAQMTGKSMLIVVPQEMAEHYVESLARADPEMIVYAMCEEE